MAAGGTEYENLSDSDTEWNQQSYDLTPEHPAITIKELLCILGDEPKLLAELRARKIPLGFLLQRDELPHDLFICLVRVVNVVCQSDGDDARSIMTFMAKKKFLENHVLPFVVNLRQNAVPSTDKTLHMIVSILKTFQKCIPSEQEAVHAVALVIGDVIKNCKTSRAFDQSMLEEISKICNRPPTTESRSPVKRARIDPIFPLVGDVVDPDPASLDLPEGNIFRLADYTDTHFSLLRQEIVEPLRRRISSYHQVKRSKNIEDTFRECRIFYAVSLSEIITTHTSKGVCFRMHFKHGFPVSWETTKLLSLGNLVCLTRNHFHDMIFGMVAKRDSAWLQKGSVDLRLLRSTDAEKLLEPTSFLMIDSQTYVVENHEVLRSLTTVKEEHAIPFFEHTVSLSSAKKLCKRLVENPELIFDISPLAKDEAYSKSCEHRRWNVHVRNPEEWPGEEQCNVDQHQLKAIQAALAREVTVITGSAGTGKTHVCLKIVHLQLMNRQTQQQLQRHAPGGTKSTISPVLFVCSTRASLDEFLLGVLSYHKDGIVRSGGKTFDTKLTTYSLEEKRKRYKQELDGNDHVHDAELKEDKKRLQGIFRNINIFNNGILSVDSLVTVMSAQHYRCFNPEKKGEILQWLLKVHGGEIGQAELDNLKRQIRQPQSRRLYGRGDADDRWIEQHMLLDFVPGKTAASPAVHRMLQGIHHTHEMALSDVNKVKDIWKLHANHRWSLYRFWINKLHMRARNRIGQIYKKMEDTVKRSRLVHDDIDLCILQSASVIGMTTSAAVKARRILKRLHTSMVIFEEASDILQSTSAAILPTDCQQLILIGEDNPKITQYSIVKRLAEDNEVDVSLIQRFIKNEYSVQRLAVQHRMSPITSRISRNLSLTDDIEHDASTTIPCNIGRITHNVFFIEHNNKTSPAKYESSFLWGLYNYLLRKGYSEQQITVLTTFPAQFELFRGKLLNQLRTVDNYRGDNDVVLFLSNGCDRKSKPGCVEINQRLVSVLTCARKGLYVIGDFDFLTSHNDLWGKVIQEARRLDWVGTGLKLVCPYHPKRPIAVTSITGFIEQDKKPGCGLPCETRLECGHTCKQPCHDHTKKVKVICKARCDRIICENGHRCQNLCFAPCETTCEELIEKELPCGHLQPAPCHQVPAEVECRDRCERKLKCGHNCTNECGMPCNIECRVLVTKLTWQCGHKVQVRCCDGPESCPEPCERVLSCGHCCSGTCGACRSGRLHVPCNKTCERTLVCGHACESSCVAQCPPCRKPCRNRCQHSACGKTCGEACTPCREMCLWRCCHVSCPKLCGEPCERKPCDKPCMKTLPCGHPCAGMCGEKCPTKCRICDKDEVAQIFFGNEDAETARFVQLEDCGHMIEVNGLDQWMSMEDESTSVQLKRCPKCNEHIRKSARYGNQTKQALYDIEKVKEKMRGNQQEIDLKFKEFLEKVQLLQRLVSTGNAIATEEDVQRLSNSVSKSSHLDKVVSRLNRCKFLIALNELFAEATKKRFHTVITEWLSQLGLLQLLRDLSTVVCGGYLDHFSEQQMSDIQHEMNRASWQLEASLAANSNIPWAEIELKAGKSLEAFTQMICKETPFTDQDNERAKTLVEQIKDRCGHAVLGVSSREKVEIIKAIGLTKGHWYKCPKGHIYAIGECGGAMEMARCPECGDSIGGHHHRLTDGNIVATEMDGARHPAWPTHAHDFEPPGEEFDYLQIDAADIEQQRALEIQIGILRN